MGCYEMWVHVNALREEIEEMKTALAIKIASVRNEGWCDGWDAGHTTGKQKAELNSGSIYWDGFSEGLWQGKLEAETKRQEESVTKGLRKLFGR